MPTLRVVVRNHSRNTLSATIYQTPPNASSTLSSLAWFSAPLAPSTETTFEWDENYSFYWGETEPLAPGVVVSSSQTLAADLATSNEVTLTNQASLTFANQRRGPNAGSLFIRVDNTVPPGVASVGISMSGAGVFAVPAQPGFDVVFTPHPAYRLTFGTFEPGEVIDVPNITSSVELVFPPGVDTLYATINADDTTTISTSP